MKYALLVMFLCFSLRSFSQIQSNTRLGIGVSYSKLGFEEFKSLTNALPSFSATVGVGIPNFLKGTFHTEIQAIRNGYKYKILHYFEEDKIRASMSIIYLKASSLYERSLVFSKKRKGKKVLSLFLGPYFSYNIGSNWKYNGDKIDEQNIKKIDAGATVGLKLKMPYSRKNHLGFDLRYSHGFANMLNHPFNVGRLRVFELGVLYEMPMGK